MLDADVHPHVVVADRMLRFTFDGWDRAAPSTDEAHGAGAHPADVGRRVARRLPATIASERTAVRLSAVGLLRRRRTPEPVSMAERVDRARALVDAAAEPPAEVHRATEDLFPGVEGLPDVDLAELTLDRLASGIQHHGGMVVRGLLTADQVDALRTQLQAGTLRAKQGGASTEVVDRMVATLVDAYRSARVCSIWSSATSARRPSASRTARW